MYEIELQISRSIFLVSWLICMFFVFKVLSNRQVSLWKVFLNPLGIFFNSYYTAEGLRYRKYLFLSAIPAIISLCVSSYYLGLYGQNI